jgi:hypothetical protein
MRYEIDPTTYAIKIYEDGSDTPFQFQPDYPNGDPFDSVAEATTWAEASIAAHSDECRVYAPNGKGLAGEVKADPNATQVILDRLGITFEEAITLFNSVR